MTGLDVAISINGGEECLGFLTIDPTAWTVEVYQDLEPGKTVSVVARAITLKAHTTVFSGVGVVTGQGSRSRINGTGELAQRDGVEVPA